jgi:CBS domain-containing protein
MERPRQQNTVLMNKARHPPVSISRELTVVDAVRLMANQRVAAVLVLDDGSPAGIFTERDLMMKVVLEGRDPGRTRIVEVMTSPVVQIHEHAGLDEAVRLMLRRRIRHLPLVNDEGKVRGMLSMRHLVADELDELEHSVRGLESYLGYDGAGG